MRSLINRPFATVCGLAVLALSTASFAGSPPPPPWNPTNKLKIHFVLNNDLRHAGELCMPRQPCPTGPQLVQRKIDYLNSVFEAHRVNLKAEATGIWEHPGNIRHDAAFDSNLGLDKVRRNAGAHQLIVVNTHGRGSAGGNADTSLPLAWVSQRIPTIYRASANQTFAHEVGHLLGADHFPGEGIMSTKPYAVGWGNWMVQDLMGNYGSLARADHYSDHETRIGAPDQSFGRFLRECYGRYSRYTGHGQPPTYNRPPRSSIIGR
jgi:hypothetical protein